MFKLYEFSRNKDKGGILSSLMLSASNDRWAFVTFIANRMLNPAEVKRRQCQPVEETGRPGWPNSPGSLYDAGTK